MPGKRKKMKIAGKVNSPQTRLAEKIKAATDGLYYISETDAEIVPFVGHKADSVTKENLLIQTGDAANSSVEERDFSELFARLTKIQEWFGEEEKATAAKFAALKNLLEKNLKNL